MQQSISEEQVRVAQFYPHVRWLIMRDMPEVLAIEAGSFAEGFAWDEENFRQQLRQRNVIGMVAEVGDKVVGYMIYSLHRTRLSLHNFAVDPLYRRRGVGKALLAKLKSKLTENSKRNRIVTHVREHNLGAQYFFKNCGFAHWSVVRRYYNNEGDTGEDAYKAVYRKPDNVKQPADYLYHNECEGR